MTLARYFALGHNFTGSAFGGGDFLYEIPEEKSENGFEYY